jgi:hypothetical protein
MSHSPSMIGRLGVSALETWAAQAAITANKSFHDEKGWDVLLQLPSADDKPVGPLDRLPPELSCMVQVKTTVGNGCSEPIKLSNWQRMCSEPMPWFVLTVRLDDCNLGPIGAHLVHVDAAWCGRVLRRLRELEPGARNELHAHTLNVSWGPDQRFAELHGRELIRRLREYVPDQRAHVTEKLRWFDELGYEDRARRVTVQLRGETTDDLYNHLADIAIGERTTFPAGWIAMVSDVRFGIEATLSTFDARSGEMEFHAPSQDRIRLKVHSSSGARSAIVECGAFRARAVFPYLPEEYDRIRLVGDDVSFVLSPMYSGGQRALMAHIRFSVPANPVTLSRLRTIADIGLAIIQDAQDPLHLSIIVDGEESSLTSGGVAPVEPALRDRLTSLDAALKVCDRFETPSGLVVPPALLQEQAEWACFMDQIMTKCGQGGKLEAPYPTPVSVGELFGVINEAGLELSDRILVLIISAYGRVSRCVEHPGRGAHLIADDSSLSFEQIVLYPSAEGNMPALQEHREIAKRKLESLGCRFILDPETHRRLVEPRANRDEDGPKGADN